MTTTGRRVAVIGAGIGGLTLAIELRRRGLDVGSPLLHHLGCIYEAAVRTSVDLPPFTVEPANSPSSAVSRCRQSSQTSSPGASPSSRPR